MTKVLAVVVLVVMVLFVISGLFRKKKPKVERQALFRRLFQPDDAFFLKILAGILLLGLLALLNRHG